MQFCLSGPEFTVDQNRWEVPTAGDLLESLSPLLALTTGHGANVKEVNLIFHTVTFPDGVGVDTVWTPTSGELEELMSLDQFLNFGNVIDHYELDLSGKVKCQDQRFAVSKVH